MTSEKENPVATDTYIWLRSDKCSFRFQLGLTITMLAIAIYGVFGNVANTSTARFGFYTYLFLYAVYCLHLFVLTVLSWAGFKRMKDNGRVDFYWIRVVMWANVFILAFVGFVYMLSFLH